MRWSAWLLATLLVCVVSASAQAPTRVALVIGNAAYEAPGWVLANPVNDATLIAQRLRPLGFDVTLVANAGKSQMEAAINAFGARLRAGGPNAVGVFYYAGHGVEHDGANLLVPVDITARTMDELRFQAPPMQFVLRDMARAGNAVNIVVLDACRNLPLPSGTRAGPAGGLAEIDDAPPDVLIAYATRAGLTAPDNPGERNSVFTRTLAEALATNAGDTVVNLFSEVQAKVYLATGRAQRPEFRSGLLRAPGFRFASAVAVAPADPGAIELAVWNGALQAASIGAFEDYLRQYPDGRFRVQAQQNLARLRSVAPLARPSSPAAQPRPASARRLPEMWRSGSAIVVGPAPSAPSGGVAGAGNGLRSLAEHTQLSEAFETEAGSRVYFTFDSYDLSHEQRAVIERQAQWLKRNPGYHMLLVGSCDERGTREYALSLGARRARAVADYLVSLGIPADKVDVTSLGKEAPLDTRGSEEAWAVNRNVRTLLMGRN